MFPETWKADFFLSAITYKILQLVKRSSCVMKDVQRCCLILSNIITVPSGEGNSKLVD
ncbi:hypothetical protein Dsin_021256 [Dipteronia sinensis]|uniref:Uncharacterized protein n=1 Tax=Dipteronia sinensis TaxID=43782 RepID=A0AAE0A0T2_9ROSI|nr:hypothetical protein Dsin_021256 [Dipteronia sinensis]